MKKIDSVTHKPLSDVEFMVTTADGTVVGDTNGKYVTDSAGTFTITDIVPGTTLVVRKPAQGTAICWTMHRGRNRQGWPDRDTGVPQSAAGLPYYQ